MNDPELVKVELVVDLSKNTNLFPSVKKRFSKTVYLPVAHLPKVGQQISLQPYGEFPKDKSGIGIGTVQNFTVQDVLIYFKETEEDHYELSQYIIELAIAPNLFD